MSYNQNKSLQQISQKRRQKILLRQQNNFQSTQKQLRSIQNDYQDSQYQLLIKQEQQKKVRNKQLENPFERFNRLEEKKKYRRFYFQFAKTIGFVIAIVHFFILYRLNVKKDEYQNIELAQNIYFFYSDLVSSIILALIILIFCLIHLKFRSKYNDNTFQILPGSTLITALDQMNKILQYKTLIRAIVTYISTCIITEMLINYLLYQLNYQNLIFKPDFSKIFGQVDSQIQGTEDIF